MSFKVINANVIDGLRSLPGESVHLVVTSPPYWSLRDYGMEGQLGLEPTAEEYIANMVEVFREVRRVLHASGSLWLNMGDSYCSDGAVHKPTTLAGPRVPAGWWNEGAAPVRSVRPRLKQDCDPKRIPSSANAIYKGIGAQGAIKPKDLCMMPARLALALQADGWWLRSQIPWIKETCLSGGAWLYARTQKGDMPVMLKDLVRLRPETVSLWNGKRWTQVVSWTDAGRPASIEIELRTGERIGCTMEHRWPTNRGLLHASDIRIGDVIDATTLPEPENPSRPDRLPDQEIGWLVGLYLAEGSGSDEIVLSGHSNETASRLERLTPIVRSFDGTMSHGCFNGDSARICIRSLALRGVIDTYINGQGAKNKCLSNRCWRRSNEFLRHLLLGYLEGDGHEDFEARRWRLGFASNDALARDLRTLCARLGFSCRLKRSKVTAIEGGRKYKIWRGTIHTYRIENDHPTTFKAKQDHEVIAIRPSRARRFWDVGVADDPHLFAMASGVLTHNCMPESAEDRPTGAIEYIYLLTKSEEYFYDREAVRMASSENTHARGHGVNPKAMGPNSRMKRDHDPAHQTTAKIQSKQNRRFSAAVNQQTPTRARRNSDWFFSSVEDYRKGFSGLIVDVDGDPLAMLVNPQPFALEMCEECDVIYSQTDYRKLPMACDWRLGGKHPKDDPGRRVCVCDSMAWVSHFATFPERLVEPCILAGSSEHGCCEHCGAPYERIVEERDPVGDWHPDPEHKNERGAVNGTAKWAKPNCKDARNGDKPHSKSQRPGAHDRSGPPAPRTIGWRATCSHPLFPCGIVPCTVLDPFSGSGRTGLAAVRRARNYVGIDLNPRYVAMSRWQHAKLLEASA